MTDTYITDIMFILDPVFFSQGNIFFFNFQHFVKRRRLCDFLSKDNGRKNLVCFIWKNFKNSYTKNLLPAFSYLNSFLKYFVLKHWDVRHRGFICKLINCGAVSSIYIWSKNFSHSAYVKSEAKDGGHWRPKCMRILSSFHSIFLPRSAFF